MNTPENLMKNIDSEKLNRLLMPGVSKLLMTNEETLGNVHATQVYIKIIDFQGMLVALGEDMFYQLISKFYKQVHVLATKYHGVFNIENPNTGSVIFGIKKEGLNNILFHPQKAALFSCDLLEEVERTNLWLKSKIHTHYNDIRNHYLRMPYSEREKIDFTDISLVVSLGVATSDLSSGYECHRMRMMNISNGAFSKYASYGGVPYMARKFCESGEKMTISVCEVFYRCNERVFHFKESQKKHISYYGNMNAFELGDPKGIKDIFFVNAHFKKPSLQSATLKISGLLNNLVVGTVRYDEVSTLVPTIRMGINEFELFQGTWGKAGTNALMTFAISELMGMPEEKAIALAVVAAWHSYLVMQKEHFQLEEEFTFTGQLPSALADSNLESFLADALSESPSSLEGNIIKSVSFFDSFFFSHEFDNVGNVLMKADLIKQLLIENSPHYNAEIFHALVKIVTE